MIHSKSQESTTLWAICWFFLYLIPPIITFIFIQKYGVNALYWDQWQLTDLMVKASEGGISFHDLHVQHNEHRILFPKLIFLALAFISKWNTKYEMYTSYILCILTFISFIGISYLNNRHIRASGIANFPNLISGVIFFSLTQSGNWLAGFQLSWFLVSFCIVLGILCLILFNQTSRYFYAVISALLCVISSFSLAYGLFSWPSLLPLLLMNNRTVKSKIIHTSLWVFFFLICIFIYLTGYVSSSSEFIIFSQPIMALRYFLNLIGGVFGTSFISPLFLGFFISISIIFSILLYLRKALKGEDSFDYAPWLSLIIFSLLFCFITTVGRASLGPAQALAPRYVTVTGLLVIALVQMVAIELRSVSKARNNSTLLLVICFISGVLFADFYVGSKDVLQKSPSFLHTRYQSKACLNLMDYLDKDFLNACLGYHTYPNVPLLLQYTSQLEKIGFRQFEIEEILSRNQNDSLTEYGAIEVPGEDPVNLHDDKFIFVSGWATNLEGQEAKIPNLENFVFLELDNSSKIFSTGHAVQPRIDLVDRFADERFMYSGWQIQIPKNKLPKTSFKIKGYLYNIEQNKLFELEGNPSFTYE